MRDNLFLGFSDLDSHPQVRHGRKWFGKTLAHAPPLVFLLSIKGFRFDLKQNLQCPHIQLDFIEHGLNVFPLHEPKTPFTFAHGAAGDTWNMEERMERVR